MWSCISSFTSIQMIVINCIHGIYMANEIEMEYSKIISNYLSHCWCIISKSSVTNLRAISQQTQPPLAKISGKITYVKFHAAVPGASVL